MTENGQPPEVTKEKQVKHHTLRYGIDDTPPWYECIGLGFQSFLTMMGGLLAAPLVVASALCIGSDDTTAAGEVVSTTIFVSGLVTLLQSTFGSRLPIVQGGSFAFMAPLFAVLSLPEYACVSPSAVNQTMINGTGTVMDPMTWQGRMQVLQGCLTVAALFEIVIGFIGGVGLLIRFIGPITIAPTILLIGMSLAHVVQHLCATQWWIAIMTTCLLGIFSQVMNKVTLHGAEYLPGVNGKKRTRFFQMYAVMLTIIISWSICAILTATNVLPSTPGSWGYEARTDIHIDSLYQTPWFRFPYPGQFGRMTFNVAGIFGMMIAIVASVLESVGDYHACAKICGAPPPPVHAINRGIFMEGIGCLISGLWGVGIGSTSFSENIGAIGLTRVASRRVIQVGATLVVFVGMFGKIGALLGTIPSPVIGGILLAVMGMICSIGISNLQTVDLNSMRNMFIIGIAFFTGIVLPPWVAAHKDTIKLGDDTVDQMVVILLTTSMTVGAVIAFTLDNALPGTREERGLHGYREVAQDKLTMENDKSGNQAFTYATYDMPFGMSAIRKLACLRYIPISPTYGSKPGDRVNNPEMNGYSNGNVDLSETSIP